MNVGSNLGQYRILRKIGAGGMGSVFVGEHVLLGRRAAIKTLLPKLSQQKEIVDRFFNEARATAAITDPGVVQVYDFGYHVDGTAYIVMELLEGEALSTRLDRLGRLGPAEALRITRQLAGALAAAHDKNIIHRDLKPENVFLVHDAEAQGGERAKVLDFGICKVANTDALLTQTGAMIGTPVYMSPEQCQGAGNIDHRSDIYGLGCVLFHMLTGTPPFEGEGAGEYIVAHMQQPAPAPSTRVQLPPMVDALVAECLAKDPDHRFQTMTALQEAIEQVLAKLDAEPVILLDTPRRLPALGAGFQSRYQAHVGPTPEVAARPPDVQWFLTTPSPTTMRSLSGEQESLVAPRSRARSVVAIVLAAGVVALIATNFVLTRDEAIGAVPVPPRMMVVEPPLGEPAAIEPTSEPAPAAATSPEPAEAPSPPAKEAVATVPDERAAPTTAGAVPAALQPDTEPAVREAPARAKKPTKRPARRAAVTRKAPRSSAPPPPPPSPEPQDDLYDTR